MRTGGNMTLSIIADLFNKRMFDKAVEVNINWDGSADNVNYTTLFGFVHLLLCAEREGWPLRAIQIYRFLVGHTHDELDATFGEASQQTYGTHSRGDSRRDILGFKSLHDFFHTCFGDRLKAFEHLQGSWDWDEFVRSYKSKAVTGIQKHFAMSLQVRDGVVTYRHKDRCNALAVWSPPKVIFPPPNRPRMLRVVSPNPPTIPPPIAPLVEWYDLEDVQKSLSKFYMNEMRYTVRA